MKLTSAIALATIASANIAQGERFVSPNVDLSMQDQLVEIDDSYENSYEHEDAYLDENGLMNYSNVPIPDTTFNDMTDIHGNSMLTNLTNSYSEDASKISVRYASIAYCARYSGNKIKNWSCKACKTVSNNMVDAEPFHVSANNTNGYVGYDKSRNIVVVAFAGTDPTSFRNVFTDLNTFAIKYHGCKDCKVHAGFYNAYMNSRSKIIGLIKKKMRSGSRVLVTGHSLGGALAAHLIADLRTSVFSFATPNTVSSIADEGVESTFLGSDNPAYEVNLDDLQAAMESEDPNVPAPTIDQLMNRIDEQVEQPSMLQSTIQAMSFPVAAPSFTFGQPRLGNQQFANWFTNGVFRVTHNRDPVPHLPPLAFGFRHPKTEIFYPSGQKSFKVCASAEDKKCSNQFIFQLGFTDHISYVRYPICNSLSNC